MIGLIADLLVRMEKRLSHRYQYQVSYTLAKQDSNYGSNDTVGIAQGGTITDVFNRAADIGPQSSDRRHAVVASGAMQLPSDVVLGLIWNFRTSTPFSARAGVDLNGDGAGGATDVLKDDGHLDGRPVRWCRGLQRIDDVEVCIEDEAHEQPIGFASREQAVVHRDDVVVRGTVAVRVE